jgi:hypothetical protein
MVVRLVCCSPCMHLPLWNMGDDFFIERVELVAWWLGLTAATQPTQVQTPGGRFVVSHKKIILLVSYQSTCLRLAQITLL